jgi:hypothetical protein
LFGICVLVLGIYTIDMTVPEGSFKGMKTARPEDDDAQSLHDDQTRLGKLKQQMYSRQEQPLDRPRRVLSDDAPEVATDWDTAPLTPEPRSTRRSYAASTIVLFLAAFIFVVAAGAGVALLVTGGNIVSPNNIDIAVRGSHTIAGGAPLELQVSVRNNNTAALELADLIIDYPKGSRTPGDVSLPSEEQRIPLGAIQPGETRTGSVRAVIFGEKGAEYTIPARLEYRLKNSNGIFSAQSQHVVQITSDTLSVSVAANNEATSGQATTLTITVRSDAQFVVPTTVLAVEYPFGFEVTRTTPENTTPAFWTLGDMAPGDTRTIRVVGTLTAAEGDERIFKITAGTRSDTTGNTVELPLAHFDHRVAVQRPFLGMDLTIGKETVDAFIAHTGQAMPIQLEWINNTTSPLSDVVIAATVSGAGVDPYNVLADRGFYRSLDSVVLWDKTTTGGDLATLTPGESGNLLLRITPKLSDALAVETDPVITLELHAAGKRLTENNVPETLQATTTRSIKIATDASFSARAMYFENPLGSVGPLPPKVEHETTYGILWEVKNTTSMVRDVTVKATLPPYVRWLDTTSPSVEDITFDEHTGEITWHVGKLLPQTGYNNNPPRRVVFGIGLVPSTIQVGQSPTLVQNQHLDGVDNFTQLPVSLTSVNDLTIQLTESQYAQAYGRVAP